MRVRLLLLLALLMPLPAALATELSLPGGRFRSVLDKTEHDVAPFRLARSPVTNAEFLAFVQRRPQWRRDRVVPLFADASYLRHWQGPGTLGTAGPRQPVTHVSWFAATAYCEAQGARLPTWLEWEYAAAASPTQADARRDPAYREAMLAWYAQTGRTLADVGEGPATVHGVRDLHALVWEWVADFNALMVSSDSREQGEDPDRLKFCGSGALTIEDKENYAVLMRIAMLSSLQAAYTTANLGFRCARSAPTHVHP